MIGMPREGATEKCDCCDEIIDRVKLNMNDKVMNLSIFGSGYPLFFFCIRHCIIFLMIILFTSSFI